MKALVYAVNPFGWATCLWLKHLWRGCLTTRLGGLRLGEMDPPPLPGDEWVRCRTILGGICGSDLGIIQQRQPADSFLQSFSTLPAVFGHENVAVVESVGAGVDPQWLGRRVTVDPGLGCRVRGIDPPCPSCRAGQFGACENFGADGQGRYRLPPGSCLGYCGPLGGSWGEFFVAHVSQLIAPPDALSDRQALLTDPLACGLHAALQPDLSAVRSVLIYGAGVLGLSVVWGLRAIGWGGRIEVVARHAHQADWARRLGASEVLALPAGKRGRFDAVAERVGGRVTAARFGSLMLSGGYDAVFECTGSPVALDEAIKWTRGGGQVVCVGTGHGRGTDLTAVWFGELTVRGSSGRGEEDFQGRKVHTYRLVHELMLACDTDLGNLLTHTFALDDYPAALAAAMDKGAHRSVKVAFEFPR